MYREQQALIVLIVRSVLLVPVYIFEVVMGYIRVLYVAGVLLQVLLLSFQLAYQIVELVLHRPELFIFVLGCKISRFELRLQVAQLIVC